MSANSDYELDEPYHETEIVFTATTNHEEHDIGAESESLNESDDAAAREQVALLKEKLETNSIKRSATPLNAKLLRIKQLLVETRQLNKESEKYNTQSAVLLSALGSLKTELESSESHRDQQFNEIIEIKKLSEELNEQLRSHGVAAAEQNRQSCENNAQSSTLIARLDELVKHGQKQQAEFDRHLDAFAKQSSNAQSQAAEIDNKVIEIRKITEESRSLLESLNLANDSVQGRTVEVNELIADFRSAKSECESLRDSLRELKLDICEERHAQQTLNGQTRSQMQHTAKLNDQQTTLLDLTQTRHEELRQELDSTIENAKKYENKLQLTEQKLKDALVQQQRSEQQYNEAQQKLENNEKLLRSAAKALAETNGQNGKFNASVSKFQHSTEQSQNLIIRTQATLESVLNRNELLERENKLLAQRLNNISSSSTRKQTHPQPSSLSPQANPFAFDGPSPNQLHNRVDNTAGSFRLMVFLAVLVPLCFIAYSFANSANADELSTQHHSIPIETIFAPLP